MLYSINHEQGLYVISSGNRYSCLGFEVAFNWASGVADWLTENGVQCEMPAAELKGTTEGYEQYRRIMGQGNEFNRRTGKRCDIQLTNQLVGLERKRVEVVDRYGETRRFWVGKSTGWLPIHLEIARTNSTGGPAVMGTPFQSVRVVRS
jgi:hypothetical protein